MSTLTENHIKVLYLFADHDTLTVSQVTALLNDDRREYYITILRKLCDLEYITTEVGIIDLEHLSQKYTDEFVLTTAGKKLIGQNNNRKTFFDIETFWKPIIITVVGGGILTFLIWFIQLLRSLIK